MASIGSFSTGVDSYILARSGNRNQHMIPVSAFRPRKCVEIGGSLDCNSVGASRIWVDDIFNRSFRCNMWGRLKMDRVKVMAEEEGGSDTGDESDDSLQATIEKSKKVLAMQRDLLEQIAERKELVSSIKNSILDPEGSKQPFIEKNGTTSSPAVAKPEASAPKKHVPNSTKLGKPEKETSLDRDPKVPLEATGLVGVQSKKGPSALPWKSYVIPSQDPSSSKNSFEELKSTKTSGSATSQKVDSKKNWKDTTANAAIISDKQPPLTEDRKYKDLKESSSEDAVEENEKPPPLAGVNVMNVILVSAECAPFSKTGGLGDVAAALPKALARRGHRVMVVAPRYGEYAEAKDSGVRKRYKVDGQDHEVNYFQAYIDGVDFVFIDSPMFRHIEKNIYGGNRVDILKRMVLFCKAAIEVPWYVPCGGVCYGDGNLAFIANDWHTALLPVYLKAYYQDHGLMKYTRSILVIHNIAHQGRGPMDDFPIVDLPPHYSGLLKFYDPVGGEHLNIFAAGLKSADRIVTVSHGYAWELKTPEGGWGLHNIINENNWKLRGIVNGIDTDDWSPELDIHLKSDGYANYSIETLKTGKPQCKAALQKELGLPVNESIPLIGFIGRLDNQKGVDLIAEGVPWMMGQNVQLVMLGTGRPDLEQLLRQFEIQYNDKVRGWVGFSVRTAHRITAGVDILLMPSRFEPCGLNQLYAMRYGTIPVVHAVGGLRDTVQQFNPYEESGVGWTFSRAETHELIHALGNCLWTYREFKNSWDGLQKRGMEQDLSWDIAAQNYEEVLVAAKFQW